MSSLLHATAERKLPGNKLATPAIAYSMYKCAVDTEMVRKPYNHGFSSLVEQRDLMVFIELKLIFFAQR